MKNIRQLIIDHQFKIAVILFVIAIILRLYKGLVLRGMSSVEGNEFLGLHFFIPDILDIILRPHDVLASSHFKPPLIPVLTSLWYKAWGEYNYYATRLLTSLISTLGLVPFLLWLKEKVNSSLLPLFWGSYIFICLSSFFIK